MATLGRACIFIALALAVYGIGASLYGSRGRERADWAESGRRAVFAFAGVLTVAFAILEVAFLRSDFSLSVVASHSSTTTPGFYKATAAWSSQEGSLLLWVWLLALWSSVALLVARRRVPDLVPVATAVLLGFGVFFCILLVGFASPFTELARAPAEGSGLNPLLRHPSMMVHPPMLYSGYTLFAVPFAFAIAALATRRLDARWILATRRFGLAAWALLGFGILLGARWSYVELGWGGYWGWDAVENAALLPWLTGTAFLHSVMIQEKRGMLKVWNVSLVLLTGILAILGTFLVRSGILESIHAFGASTLGVPFLIFIGILVIGSVTLVASRRDGLRSEHRIESVFSREAVFLVNNLLLVGLAFVIFWGTFFPLISEAVTGTKASVGPPWFDRYTVPLALGLVLFAGVGPLIAWRAASWQSVRRAFAIPLGAGALTAIAVPALSDAGRRPLAVTMFALGAFVIAGVVQETARGAAARRSMTGESPPRAALELMRRNRRRYGGYTVHAGMAVLFVGVAASSALGHVRDVRMTPGQTAKVGGYDLRYVRATDDVGTEKISFGAVLDVRKDGKHVATLRPSRHYFPSQDTGGLGQIGRFFEGEATSEVGLRTGLRRDVWTAVSPDLSDLKPFIDRADRQFAASSSDVKGLLIFALARRYRDNPPPATFRMLVSPMVTWIWIGALIMVLGALIAIWPAPLAARRRAAAASRAAYESRLARELSRA
jgi:cytochrome c-type biogenesis protein CcmF